MPVTNRDCWEVRFPDPENALPNGLVAYGGDLSPLTLLSAYGQGIFPWYSESEPILWWSPDPRCLLRPADFHVSVRSSRKIRNSGFSFSIDRAFREVLCGCAMPRKDCPDTWLLPEMQDAYERLYDLGCAHSIEIWLEGKLAGGVYGVALGQIFFGESMFRLAPEASRAALVCLVELMKNLGMVFLDCQMETPHMLAMGAMCIPRGKFLRLLPGNIKRHVSVLARGGWRKFEASLGSPCGICRRDSAHEFFR